MSEKKDGNLTQAEALRLFAYDPDTGAITRVEDVSHNAKKGQQVGRVISGHLSVVVNGYIWRLDRLAWLLHKGYVPEFGVDRQNGDKTDYRWCNLLPYEPPPGREEMYRINPPRKRAK